MLFQVANSFYSLLIENKQFMMPNFGLDRFLFSLATKSIVWPDRGATSSDDDRASALSMLSAPDCPKMRRQCCASLGNLFSFSSSDFRLADWGFIVLSGSDRQKTGTILEGKGTG